MIWSKMRYIIIEKIKQEWFKLDTSKFNGKTAIFCDNEVAIESNIFGVDNLTQF